MHWLAGPQAPMLCTLQGTEMTFVLMSTDEYKYLKLFNSLYSTMFNRLPAYVATNVLKIRRTHKRRRRIHIIVHHKEGGCCCSQCSVMSYMNPCMITSPDTEITTGSRREAWSDITSSERNPQESHLCYYQLGYPVEITKAC